MALRLNVSLNEVMVCGALIRPVYVLSSDELLVEYKLLSSRREPVVSPTGDSECDFLPSALSDRAYPYQARLEDCVSDPGPVDKVLFCSCGLV